MQILSIGNSFSEDAQRYVNDIARAAGESVKTINLYIGGCSLERHYNNMKSGERAYTLGCDGHRSEFPVSIDEGLENRAWDVITLQQASHLSAHPESYHPYIDELAAYVRQKAPTARIYIHQTWAYEEGSERLQSMGFSHHEEMLSAVCSAYEKARTDIRADGLIPSGELFGALYGMGLTGVQRDTFHASFGLGRYALGLLWFRVLTGKSVIGNRFFQFDEPIEPGAVALAQSLVERLAQKYGY